MNLNELFSLAGRTALITGGSRGIGRMIAEGFIAQGAKVYISSRKADACFAAAEEMSRNGGECIALPYNLAGMDGIRALAADYCGRENGRLDILVNNAGAAWGAPLRETPEAGWDKVVDLNLKSPFFLTQCLSDALKATASPDRLSKVINIASIEGLGINNDLETYSYHASKSGLLHLTRRMAATLVKDNIAVNAIAPGAYATEMNLAARDNADAAARFIPSGRVGRDEDMACAALYLAARSGDYVIGSTLVVDGGMLNARLPHFEI